MDESNRHPGNSGLALKAQEITAGGLLAQANTNLPGCRGHVRSEEHEKIGGLAQTLRGCGVTRYPKGRGELLGC